MSKKKKKIDFLVESMIWQNNLLYAQYGPQRTNNEDPPPPPQGPPRG